MSAVPELEKTSARASADDAKLDEKLNIDRDAKFDVDAEKSVDEDASESSSVIQQAEDVALQVRPPILFIPR